MSRKKASPRDNAKIKCWNGLQKALKEKPEIISKTRHSEHWHYLRGFEAGWEQSKDYHNRKKSRKTEWE